MASAGISIGRLETNQLVLHDLDVSNVHARFSMRMCKRRGPADGEVVKRLFVMDSSATGTYVGGGALPYERWVMLADGDVISLRNPHGNASHGVCRVRYREGDGSALQVKWWKEDRI